MKLENDLGRDPIRKLVLNIAIPSMLAQFVSVLYSIVDRIYIGNIPEIGNLALAGAGVCGPVVTMIGSVAFLVGVGGSPLMSIRMGEGNLAQARKILANCFLLLNVLAVLLMAGALLTRRPLLLLFGASETTLPYALDYYTYYLFGTVFALLANGMNQFVICQGFAKKGMAVGDAWGGAQHRPGPSVHLWAEHGGTWSGHRHCNQPTGQLPVCPPFSLWPCTPGAHHLRGIQPEDHLQGPAHWAGSLPHHCAGQCDDYQR